MTGRAVAVFGSSATQPHSSEWDEAEKAGRRLADAGLTVVTGGYSGVMEAASKGATGEGGHVIGVTVPSQFPNRPGANPFVSEERPAESLTERIGLLTTLVDGVMVLPGSIGTAAELLVAWNINHISRNHGTRRLPIVAVGEIWASLWELLTDRAGAIGDDVRVAGDVDEAVDWMLTRLEIR